MKIISMCPKLSTTPERVIESGRNRKEAREILVFVY